MKPSKKRQDAVFCIQKKPILKLCTVDHCYCRVSNSTYLEIVLNLGLTTKKSLRATLLCTFRATFTSIA